MAPVAGDELPKPHPTPLSGWPGGVDQSASRLRRLRRCSRALPRVVSQTNGARHTNWPACHGRIDHCRRDAERCGQRRSPRRHDPSPNTCGTAVLRLAVARVADANAPCRTACTCCRQRRQAVAGRHYDDRSPATSVVNSSRSSSTGWLRPRRHGRRCDGAHGSGPCQSSPACTGHA